MEKLQLLETLAAARLQATETMTTNIIQSTLQDFNANEEGIIMIYEETNNTTKSLPRSFLSFCNDILGVPTMTFAKMGLRYVPTKI